MSNRIYHKLLVPVMTLVDCMTKGYFDLRLFADLRAVLGSMGLSAGAFSIFASYSASYSFATVGLTVFFLLSF